MFSKEINKRIAILLFLIVVLVGVWIVLDFIRIGPGLPPSEGMPKWYIPETWREIEPGCTSFFPEISPYCNFGNFSGGKFVLVWYFDDESKFLEGEDTLYCYLEEKGNVFQQELNISTELQEIAKRREAENSWRPIFGPYFFNATGYESTETSGYFVVYERPFLKEREDYFIAYYGIMGLTDLTEETPALKKLIAKSYYISNEEGKVDGLNKGNKKGKGNLLLPWF